jgi:hypothetical protein
MIDRKRRPQGTKPAGVHPIGTPSGSSPNTGPLAAATWLIARDLVPHPPKWFVTITFPARDGSKFDLEILSEEWGFRFERQSRVSWIRVTDIAFSHGQDEHQLLPHTPPLKNVGALLRSLEKAHGVKFELDAPIIRTNLDGAEHAIVEWIRSL